MGDIADDCFDRAMDELADLDTEGPYIREANDLLRDVGAFRG